MTMHDELIVIDGLNVSKFDRKVFEEMRRGNVTAANCTCSVWENFRDTMENISIWKKHLALNADILLEVRTPDDIIKAKKENKTGIILGFQNGAPFEDNPGFVELFRELGVGIAQLTYNTQNLIGTGCYEPDGGLSGFGKEIVSEMNRVGMVVDLSHVGPQTSIDTIEFSKKPVAYSHCLPSGLKKHPRNKSDEQLQFIAQNGGFIGITMFSPFLKKGLNSTVHDYVAAIDYVTELVGDDCVGIGTDFTQGHGADFFEWITHDKGKARKLVEFGEIANPEGIRSIEEFPNITSAMLVADWEPSKIKKIVGENWLHFFSTGWKVE